jgi:glycosyltransferase involved in cell wall biosynthesis
LIEDTLPREVLLDLYRACDAYVSLHRCEGFGRGIAEAMLLGKPVIATAYSGNLDFCTPDTALLVPATTRKVRPGDYPEAQGMDWAEPDVEAAAEAMRRCALAGWQPEGTAVQRVADTYSAQQVGHNYRQRLECLAR